MAVTLIINVIAVTLIVKPFSSCSRPMSRPTEPEKKQALLEQCFAAIIESGVLDTSINVLAKQIGTSGRMLIYHFGTKQELERQLIALLEVRLREKLWAFQEVSVDAQDSLAPPLLAMWQHFTSPDMQGLLKLTMELNQRAMQGDPETQAFFGAGNAKVDRCFGNADKRAK
jgi:AcrR family transcriptional regulator